MGLRTIVNRETEKLTKVVTRVPVTTGATLRRLLQVRAVRHVQKELGNYFNNNRVLFLSGMRNYEIAVALSDYTKNLSFADPVFQAGSPLLLGSLAQLELYARGNELVAGQKPFRLLEKSLAGLKNMRVANAMAKSHLIVGTFGEIKAIGTVANLEGKTLITSAVHDDQLAFYKQCKVNLVIDVTPNLFGRGGRRGHAGGDDPGAPGPQRQRAGRRRVRGDHHRTGHHSHGCCTRPASSATSGASPSSCTR